MSLRELRAAGITDAALQESYETCRKLNAAHGKTYYLATLLLPPEKRPFVHALYGFARYADDIVDDLASTLTPAEKAHELRTWSDGFFVDLKKGSSQDPVCAAAIHTALTWDIPVEHFEAFIHSMTMDLTVETYETYEDLYEYVYGSAAVIGLQMVPILEPTSQQAYVHATQLGIAFQLANFIRDVGEDLYRHRVYLPLAELQEHGVTRADLEKRVLTPNIVEALKFQIARVRQLEQESRPGIAMLSAQSQPCIDAARVLYCGIVDAVEAIEYDVFNRRAVVPQSTRLAVAGKAWLKSRRAR